MDEETKKLLVENNEMLKKLVFFQKLNQIYRVVYWVIIILSTIGAFYFIQPYLGSLMGVYTGGVGVSSNIDSLNGLKNLGTNKDVQNMLKDLNN